MGLLSQRAPRVDKLERRGDSHSLLRALDYRETGRGRGGELVDAGAPVRAQAATALARVDGSEVQDGLARALTDPDDSVRLAAIAALRERGEHGAVEPLAAAATSKEPRHALARNEAVAALEAMRDTDVPLRVAAALIARAEEIDEDDGSVMRRLAQGAPDGGVRLTISYLMSVLGEGARGARAVSLLVYLTPDSVPPLIEALDDPPKREQAAVALGRAHVKNAVEPLCRLMLRSDDPGLRRAAAWALGEIRDPGAVEPLLLAASDAEYAVRAEAGTAFDRFGNTGMVLALSALAQPRLGEGAAQLEDGGRRVELGGPMAERPAAEPQVGAADELRSELDEIRAALRREEEGRAEAESRLRAEPEPVAEPEPEPEPVAEPEPEHEPVAEPEPEPEPVAEQPTVETAATAEITSEPEPPDAAANGDGDAPALSEESLASMDVDALAEFYDIAADGYRSASRMGRAEKAARWQTLANAALDEASRRQLADGTAPRKGGLLRRRRSRLRDQLRVAVAERAAERAEG